MPKSVKYIFLVITSTQQNLIVETSQSTMLCKITFQLQNVFSYVFSVFFVFFVFGYVIVMVFQSKFIKCKFIHFVIAPQSWGVSGNGHNQISLSSLHFHFSFYLHHLIFHLSLPPSLTFPFPPCTPGCCCC